MRPCRAAIARLAEYLGDAQLDALIVVGDDQDELYHRDNMPGILVYYGETIPNVPLGPGFKGPEWARRATARWFEEKEPRDYPVDTGLARHLIDVLIDREFDIAASNRVPDGQGEGHAIGFVHKRLMPEIVPIVPVCINTYYPPNQPTPKRCYKLGQAIRAAVQILSGQARVGIIGSGGLSHFVVDEALDRGFIDMLRRKDAAAIQAIAARKAQFRQLGDPQLDLRRRRRLASRARMVAVRTGLPHPGRHRHRARLCLLGITGSVADIALGTNHRLRA